MKLLAFSLLLFLVLSFSCVDSQQVLETTPIADVVEFETPVPQNPCLDQDVWVYLEHKNDMDPTCLVIVYIPKYSLESDSQNCPAEDTKVIGEGRIDIDKFGAFPGLSTYFGMHVVVLKKGFLNNPKNYTTKPPKHIEIPANNFNIRHIGF